LLGTPLPGFLLLVIIFYRLTKRIIAMKILSIAPVVPAFKGKGRTMMTPSISSRKVSPSQVSASPSTKQDRRIRRPSPGLDYYLLALTGLYLIILTVGCWVVMQIFWQWTTDGTLKWFQLLDR
jgi:hypothetical protein